MYWFFIFYIHYDPVIILYQSCFDLCWLGYIILHGFIHFFTIRTHYQIIIALSFFILYMKNRGDATQYTIIMATAFINPWVALSLSFAMWIYWIGFA